MPAPMPAHLPAHEIITCRKSLRRQGIAEMRALLRQSQAKGRPYDIFLELKMFVHKAWECFWFLKPLLAMERNKCMV